MHRLNLANLKTVSKVLKVEMDAANAQVISIASNHGPVHSGLPV
jgi:hypothetical protein